MLDAIKQTLPSTQMRYGLEERPITVLTNAATEALSMIRTNEYSVLVGPNNCGKSFLLKSLTEQIGPEAAYVGPARYTNFNMIPFYTRRPNKKSDWWNQFIRWKHENLNQDSSPINLQQAIAEFDDETRKTFFEIMRTLLKVDIEISQADPKNFMSQRYLSCSGHNLSYTSSGVRLIASLLTCLLDKDYSTVLIDEPELGISPEAQGVLADFLFDTEARRKYFSHVKTLVFATHSTVFLDRLRITNNYVVSKSGDTIDIERVREQRQLNRIHFFLLGNRFETLYLPNGILIVEGKCDEVYLKRVIEVEMPSLTLSVISAHDDSRVKQVLHMAASFFGNIQKSPYRDRIFPVLDSRHAAGLVQVIEGYGIPTENIVVWKKNGIEHYYPKKLIDQIYGDGDPLQITGDHVSRNGITYKKFELAQLIASRLTAGEVYPDEFVERLLTPLRQLTS